MSRRLKNVVLYLLMVGVAVAVSVIVVNNSNSYSDGKNNSLEIQLERNRISALENVCRGNIADRVTQIKILSTSQVANRAVSNDLTVSNATRKIRRDEARVQREAIADLVTRVDPTHGGPEKCKYGD